MPANRLTRPSRWDLSCEVAATLHTVAQLVRWRVGEAPYRGFPQPFAGQWARRATVAALLNGFRPDTIVETGTFVGFTTRALAKYGCPVHSAELVPAYFHLARMNLRRAPNVTLHCGDSVEVLRGLAAEPTIERPFFYLDAHGTGTDAHEGESLPPLVDEVGMILRRWPDVVIVIEDCLVPGDPAYAYDVYAGSPIAAVALPLGEDVVAAYPGVTAADESGEPSGTLYLAKGPEATAVLRRIGEQSLVAVAA